MDNALKASCYWALAKEMKKGHRPNDLKSLMRQPLFIKFIIRRKSDFLLLY